MCTLDTRRLQPSLDDWCEAVVQLPAGIAAVVESVAPLAANVEVAAWHAAAGSASTGAPAPPASATAVGRTGIHRSVCQVELLLQSAGVEAAQVGGASIR